jgi:hypothetical protein
MGITPRSKKGEGGRKEKNGNNVGIGAKDGQPGAIFIDF